MKPHCKSLAAGALVLALSCLTGSAVIPTVLSDNLNQPSSLSFADDVSATKWVAGLFGTDASNYSLDAITLRMDIFYATGTPVLRLFSDAGGQPGAALGVLANPGSFTVGNDQLVTFTGNGLLLGQNTTYWAVLSAVVFQADTQDYNWKYTDNVNGSGVGFRTTSAASLNGGATWDLYSDFPEYMQVVASVVPVPEPLAWTGLVAGGLFLAGLARMRRRFSLVRGKDSGARA